MRNPKRETNSNNQSNTWCHCEACGAGRGNLKSNR